MVVLVEEDPQVQWFNITLVEHSQCLTHRLVLVAAVDIRAVAVVHHP